MAYVASNARLGLVDINTVSTTGPGISALPAVTLEPQLGETCTAWDPNLGGGEFAYFKSTSTVVASQTVSSVTISGTTATVTTGSAHGLVPGQVVTITGAVPTGYNGVGIQLLTASGTTFTYTIPSGNAVPTVSATTQPTYTVYAIAAGQVCELAYSLSGGYLNITAL